MMKIYYICERCGVNIDIVDVEMEEGEEDSGLDYLTPEECQDIIKIDMNQDVIFVLSLCEDCISLFGV